MEHGPYDPRFIFEQGKLIAEFEKVDDAKAYVNLAAENARLTQELETAREGWRIFVDLMEPIEAHMDCICLDPPGYDNERDEDDPSEHSQYCIMYLKAYAEAMANGTETPA